MPYDAKIEQRIDQLVARWKDLAKKKMFGGICYLVNGNMAFGIWQEYLIVRTGPEIASEKLQQKHTRPFDITGKVMKGWVMVARGGYAKNFEMKAWLDLGKLFARSLPAKNKSS